MQRGHEPVDKPSLEVQLVGREVKARLFGRERTVQLGKYEVLRRIGSGGMGAVFAARDPQLQRKVALKVIRGATDARALDEARALARLSHPNVVTVYEVGTDDDRIFLAMEFIEGPTLRQWLETGPATAEIRRALAQVAHGLSAAHAAGLVHRDVKPDNIIVGADGRARVVDFGVAKSTHEAAASLHSGPLEATTEAHGSPAYMAAEQFEGRAVGPATDVFALCVTIHEVFARQRPFAGDDAIAVSRAVTADDPTALDLPALPARLRSVVARGLSADPTLRPSMQALADALAPRSRRSLLVIVAALATALVAVLVYAGAPANPGERAAFDRILATSADDDARLAAARAFLDHYGGDGLPARRAVAHATAGRILWARSCDDPWLDLCVAEQPVAVGGACLEAARGPFVARPRDPDRATQARAHLRAAAELAGVEAPDDPAWADAMGSTRVALADGELERYLLTPFPDGLDFAESRPPSTAAFELYMSTQMERAAALMQRYREVKGTTPRWEIAAALRTGLVYEGVSEPLAGQPPPPAVDRHAYCEALRTQLEPPRKAAANAYAYCVDRATEAALLDLPEADHCSRR
jgi:predicted Ser/Thr protein kinase